MARNKPKAVLYRRKREHKTDYKKRLHLLLSDKPRVVVRFTNQRVLAQLVQFKPMGDFALAAVDSEVLKKLGWTYSRKNTSAAYLTGLLLGKKAVTAGKKNAIMDTGFMTVLQKGKIYAFLKGLLDAGMEIPYGKDEIFPSDARIQGKHVIDYATLLKGNKEIYQARFTEYLKNKSAPESMSTQFDAVKAKILGS
jgi:large subunit ribosomal protein L18